MGRVQVGWAIWPYAGVRRMAAQLRSNLSQITRNDLIVLLLVIFTVSASIELAYGSPFLGIGFLILAVLMLIYLTKDSRAGDTRHERSPLLMALGAVVVIADLVFNYVVGSEIQTFDTMVVLLGFSISLHASGSRYSDIGNFSTYFSSIFLVLFLLLFMIPLRVSMYLPYLYGHYAVTIPVVFILSALGLNLRIPEFRLIEVLGPNHALLRIDLACFGWYSLLLITSMVLAYNLTIERNSWRRVAKVLLIMGTASYLANLLRVSILVVLAYYYDVETMLTIHPHLGWILFAIIVLPLSLVFLKSNSNHP